ncbi:SIR2 family NAD-dependent protein deacylase [Prevotella pallens]|uniref:SIR2 family NAD-dependent protein deacylase n=1 Tax=Prevotella pallens TaxID=60133 RepID=UPI001CACC04F|nr:NAD-dependent deacylase [Prevotella pallens]MBF1481592.1 NAD-dependent deacylase [Prevotella pallens]MBF1500086.1 NAD-dependent deacylase [Prevotella pallens]MBF1501467.1 NAD-dependent deacylase [Prevotella pallens]
MKKIVFLTGAGMSVESGFKTFRGNDGLWENYPVEKVATHEAWEDNPEFINNFYNGLRKKLFTAKPNDGHLLIKQLEDKYKVTVITQNVDDLHEMAGSTNVIHLHGELKKVCSSADAYNPKYRKELTEDAPNVMPDEKAGDGSLLRPFIVFFGESVPMIEPAIKEVSEADIFVIIGTSLNVYPAASLIHYVRTEVPVYLIDPNDVDSKYDTNITVIRKGASEGMCELIKEL